MDEINKNTAEGQLVLRTEGLIKRYGKRTVVNDVSFDVESESFQTSFQNIGYKLPNSEYWQLAAVDEEVDRRCVRKTKIFGVTEEYDPKEMVIFYDHHQDVEWIHYEEATESQNSKYARFVNFFAPVVKDDAVDRTLLSITPVKM